ncbi:universal stress protein [Bradyrhizobium lablabi]|uniref:universal stress protein n=1 Tax=Bradyrhizobium lablabi TaxID=722472 RepID=UPI001BACF1FF|nr:universal stress protein [Bradyrhizobium lablabi]MBR0697840.1 universal stress protein [Bradyrhizobium lablabi]
MAIRDILLTLRSYPDATPASVIDDAVSLASALGAHIAAISYEAHVEVPGSLIGSSLGNVGGIIAREAGKSREAAAGLLAAFQAMAGKASLSSETIMEKCRTQDVSSLLVDYARLRDLTIASVPEFDDQWHAEAIIFGSGRPILVLPESRSKPFELRTAVVAWDFSRAAARAVADAIPLLERARNVRIVTVENEKTFGSKHSTEALATNLARHGIEIVVERIDAAGRPIHEVLEAAASSCAADFLVMGAYGHSRLREFILGGATRSLLSKPPLPILFSH